MALLWQKQSQGDVIEVRSAGASRRLYSNGVFHSQYNPNHRVSGGVWDLLLLPAFGLPQGQIQRVLVLGVGGGAVIRMLQHFLRPRQIIGVDLSSVHLQVARRFFGVKSGGGTEIDLVCDDARHWLQQANTQNQGQNRSQNHGQAFDLIIDDLFSHVEGEACRAIAADADWLRLLCAQLSANGVLVMNFESRAELLASAACAEAPVRQRFAAAREFSTRHYENRIGAFYPQPWQASRFRQQLQAFQELDRRRKSCRLDFSCRKVY